MAIVGTYYKGVLTKSPSIGPRRKYRHPVAAQVGRHVRSQSQKPRTGFVLVAVDKNSNQFVGEGGPWALRGGGSLTWNDLNTSRQVTAVALGGAQNGSYADKTWQAFVEGARNFAFGPAALEPFANVAYVHVGGDVSESGLAAMSGSTSFDATDTTLGAHGSYALPAGLTAQATLGCGMHSATSRRC